MLIIGPKTPTSNNIEHCPTLDGRSVNSSPSVRNLGVLFDSNLSFDSHISKAEFLGTEHRWCEDPIESAPFIRDRAPMVQRTLLNLLRLLGTEHRWCRGPY